MKSFKLIVKIIICVLFLIPGIAFTQVGQFHGNPEVLNPALKKKSLQLHYNLGSSFTFIPRFGSVTGFYVSPYIRYPVSPKLSVDAGLVAGQFYTEGKFFNPENVKNNSFSALSVYGSASYRLNQRLTLYGAGIKQLPGTFPLYHLPANSFTLGSTLDFGSFSIGAEVQMTKWNNNFYSPYPFRGSQLYFPSYPW